MGATMTDIDQIFENQPTVLNPDEAAAIAKVKRETVYDWKYRPEKYEVPEGMIFKFGRKVLIRTDIFKAWFISRCET
jgi:hypothetical protein